MKRIILIIAASASLHGCVTLTPNEKAAIIESIGTRILSGK